MSEYVHMCVYLHLSGYISFLLSCVYIFKCLSMCTCVYIFICLVTYLSFSIKVKNYTKSQADVVEGKD